MTIGLLGGGAWGTTLAALLAGKGHAARVWEFDPAQAERVAAERENRRYLPGIRLPDGVEVTAELEAVVSAAEALVFVVPSRHMRGSARAVARLLTAPAPLMVCATKGLERGTLARMTEVIAAEIPAAAGRIVALVGPSLAREVAAGIPTAVVAASRSAEAARDAQALFTTDRFRVYTNDDVIGVELGVALKNVIAIAAGLSDGLGFGANTRAALVTRGLAEMTRLGVVLGADPLTFAGLAGLGDLVATCSSPLSRNRRVGEAVARGEKLEQVLVDLVEVAEGVETTPAALELAARAGVELPIASQVFKVLFEGKNPADAVSGLMTRVPTCESTAHPPSAGRGRIAHG